MQKTYRAGRAWARFVVFCCSALILWIIWDAFQRDFETGVALVAVVAGPIVLGIAFERLTTVRRRLLADATLRANVLRSTGGVALVAGISLCVYGWSGCGRICPDYSRTEMAVGAAAVVCGLIARQRH